MTKSRHFLLWLVLFAVGFLIALIWLYPQLSGARGELQSAQENLETSRTAAQMAQLRDLAGLLYFETARQNYGVAADYSTRYFDALSAFRSRDTEGSASLQPLVEQRDTLTAALAQGSPAALAQTQRIFLQTFRLTNPQVEIISPDLPEPAPMPQ